jgi:DNA-binding transcriptional MerR regulator
MLTVAQVHKRANVSENTVRNYVKDYPELFSASARGEIGTRLFSEDDTEMICIIATLRKSGVPPSQIIESVRNGNAPPVIDITATVAQDPTNSLQASNDPGTSLQILSNALQTTSTALQDRLNVIEVRLQAQEVDYKHLLRSWVWWHRLEGVIVGVAFCAFVIWLYWLLMYM